MVPKAPESLPDRILAGGGGSVLGIVAFGSRVTGASPDERSAWDLFVVVDDYRRFYDRAVPAFGWRRRPGTLAAVNRWLPPNVAHLPETDGPGAKLFVISEDDLERRLRPDTVDHFCRARLMQKVEILGARDDTVRRRLEARLEANRRSIVDWLHPFLPASFRAEDFGRRLLEVSYRTEVRPESGDRAAEVFAVQRDTLVELYGPVLEAAAADGVLVGTGDGAWAPTRAATAGARRGAAMRTTAAKVLATLRWTKHLVTFEGWLDYIVAKVERRLGVRIELTDRERRWPLLFLWPKFFRVMRARRGDTREAGP